MSVLFKPGFNAVRMEMVRANQLEESLTLAVRLKADCTEVCGFCRHKFRWQLLNDLFVCDFLFVVTELFIHDCMVGCRVHTSDWRLVIVVILVHNCFSFVIPIDEIHVVLAGGVEIDRSVLGAVLLDARIRLFILFLSCLWLLLSIRIHDVLKLARF